MKRSLGSDGTRRTESALPFLPAVGVQEFAGFFERAAARMTATRKDTDQENIKSSSRTCEMGADSLGWNLDRIGTAPQEGDLTLL
jgi:hypothetical protein